MARRPLSLIVVFHDIAREAERTRAALASGYLRGVSPKDSEVLEVDAGSASPLTGPMVWGRCPNARLLRTPPAPSPAAVNTAVRQADGAESAVAIEGARMLMPGIIARMLAGLRAAAAPVAVTLPGTSGPQGAEFVNPRGR